MPTHAVSTRDISRSSRRTRLATLLRIADDALYERDSASALLDRDLRIYERQRGRSREFRLPAFVDDVAFVHGKGRVIALVLLRRAGGCGGGAVDSGRHESWIVPSGDAVLDDPRTWLVALPPGSGLEVDRHALEAAVLVARRRADSRAARARRPRDRDPRPPAPASRQTAVARRRRGRARASVSRVWNGSASARS